MPERLPPERIRAILKDLRGDLSLAAFAEKVGKPGQASQFSKYERGTKDPSTDTLREVAEALGFPEAVFYAEPASEGGPLTALEIARLRDRMRRVVEDAGEVLRELDGALGLSVEQKDLQDEAYLFGPGGEPQEDDAPDAPRSAKPTATNRRQSQRGGRQGTGRSPD